MSNIFKKRCFSCGAESNKLYEGMCENCYKQDHPPIKETKPLNIKVCNMCDKIHYNNSLYEYDDFVKILPDIMRKRVQIDEAYKLNTLEIIDLQREGNKISFDVKVDCDLI